MLDERLGKLSKISSPKGFSFVAHWITQGVATVDALSQFAISTPGIKNSEIIPILRLFSSMKIISLNDGNTIENADDIKIYYSQGEDAFNDWFIKKFVDFILEENVINTERITYSINDDAYIMASTAIRPTEHACYRNILTDYGVITLLKDNRYLVNTVLDQALKKPQNSKKITEAQLKIKLQKLAEQGERGELFVLDFEKRRITRPDLQKDIKRISLIDVSAGFDIVSFNSNESQKIDRFIEVKTFCGLQHFIWSRNEIQNARIMGNSYFLYLVDDNDLDNEQYEPIIIQNPYDTIFKSGEWIYEPDAYRVVKISDSRTKQ